MAYGDHGPNATAGEDSAQPHNENGADVAASPTLVVECSGRVWAIALPGVADSVTAVMHVRAPRVPSHRGCQHRDARRIGSGLPVALRLRRTCCLFIRWSVRTGFLRPVHSPASGPVRRSVGVRGTFPFHLAVPFDHPVACRSWPLFRRAEARLSFRHFRPPPGDLPASRHSLHLRFVWVIRRLSQTCFPTLLRASLPYQSASVFPIVSNGFPSELQVRFQRLDIQKLRLESESRKQNLHRFSQMRRTAVDKSVDGLV